jgi:hypothetical protein
MGTLKYDGMSVEFDDRLLAHIQVAVLQKLRRQEAFGMTWQEPGPGGGRTAIWIHPAAMLTFHYGTNENPNIDRAWAEKLVLAASSPAGMLVTDADGQPGRSATVATSV